MITLSESERKELGFRLRNRRTYLHYTQNSLAEAIKARYPDTKISSDTIWRIETGKNKKPNESLLKKIGIILECGHNYLLGKTNTPDDYFTSNNPNFTKGSIELFLYENDTFRKDIAYVATSMHKDFYQPMLDLFHQVVLGHRLVTHNQILEEYSKYEGKISTSQEHDISKKIRFDELLVRHCIEKQIIAKVTNEIEREQDK